MITRLPQGPLIVTRHGDEKCRLCPEAGLRSLPLAYDTTNTRPGMVISAGRQRRWVRRHPPAHPRPPFDQAIPWGKRLRQSRMPWAALAGGTAIPAGKAGRPRSRAFRSGFSAANDRPGPGSISHTWSCRDVIVHP